MHETFAPTQKQILYAEKLVRGCQAQADAGIGVYTVDGKMVDIPFFEDAKRIIRLQYDMKNLKKISFARLSGKPAKSAEHMTE